jgi:hypothetical protein
MGQLLVLGVGLGIRNYSRSTIKCQQIQKSRHKTSRQLLQPHKHFTEHLAGVTERPNRKYDEKLENSSLRTGGSRTRPASIYKDRQSDMIKAKRIGTRFENQRLEARVGRTNHAEPSASMWEKKSKRVLLPHTGD